MSACAIPGLTARVRRAQVEGLLCKACQSGVMGVHFPNGRGLHLEALRKLQGSTPLSDFGVVAGSTLVLVLDNATRSEMMRSMAG